MQSRTSWRELVPGLVALTVIIAIVAAVFLFTGIGRVSGDTVLVHVVTDQARGVMPGTPVWLSGQQIGVVESVGFRAPSSDTLGVVVLTLKVREADAQLVRRDSRVQVRSGANVIGPMVVYVQGGSPSSPGVRDGDTLLAHTQSDLGAAAAQLGDAMEEAAPMMADARLIMARLKDPNGTIGAMLAGGTTRGPMADAKAMMASMTARPKRAAGAPGPADVMAHASRAMARVDSIRALLASPNSSYGRFRRDSTLARTIGEVATELGALRMRLADADGTLPRLRSDSAIWFAVTAAREEMALLFEDVRKRPIRYLHF